MPRLRRPIAALRPEIVVGAIAENAGAAAYRGVPRPAEVAFVDQLAAQAGFAVAGQVGLIHQPRGTTCHDQGSSLNQAGFAVGIQVEWPGGQFAIAPPRGVRARPDQPASKGTKCRRGRLGPPPWVGDPYRCQATTRAIRTTALTWQDQWENRKERKPRRLAPRRATSAAARRLPTSTVPEPERPTPQRRHLPIRLTKGPREWQQTDIRQSSDREHASGACKPNKGSVV